MNTQNRKETDKDIVFLFGPTAVGKTDLLCSFFCPGYEVVNADSVQVYRQLDIGSAKADAETLKKIPHHLIDILDPWEKFNVADFVSLADKACDEIISRGNTPVISGGTAYYFKTFMYGLSEAPQSDETTRKEVAQMIAEQGLTKAHELLEKVDPISGNRINVNDSYRISRALEVYMQTGKKLSDFKVPDKVREGYNIKAIGLYRPKTELDERIRQRVRIMFDMGLVDEIKKLVEMGATSEWQSMQAIGYREFMSALAVNPSFDNLDLEAISQAIVMNSIHYAKRQMTFFKSLSSVSWARPEEVSQLFDGQKQL